QGSPAPHSPAPAAGPAVAPLPPAPMGIPPPSLGGSMKVPPALTIPPLVAWVPLLAPSTSLASGSSHWPDTHSAPPGHTAFWQASTQLPAWQSEPVSHSVASHPGSTQAPLA